MALVTGWTEYYETTYTQTIDGSLTAVSPTDANLRIVIPSSALSISGTKIKITFKAGTTTQTLDGASIGLQDSIDLQDYEAPPTRVTFSGNNYVEIAANSEVVSDAITFSLDETDSYLIHGWWDDGYSFAYWGSGGDNFYLQNAEGLSDQTMVQDISLTLFSARKGLVTKIEVFNTIWQATCTTEPTDVWFNTTKGTEETAIANLNIANEWYWEANVLYVYSTSDPDTAYVSPGIGTDAPIDVLFFGTEL